MGTDNGRLWTWVLVVLALGMIVLAICGASKDRTMPSDPIMTTGQ